MRIITENIFEVKIFNKYCSKLYFNDVQMNIEKFILFRFECLSDSLQEKG